MCEKQIWPHRSEELIDQVKNNLCEKCAQWAVNGQHFAPWLHCHHEKEQKSKCPVCLDGRFQPIHSMPYSDRKLACLLCPGCGRRL